MKYEAVDKSESVQTARTDLVLWERLDTLGRVVERARSISQTDSQSQKQEQRQTQTKPAEPLPLTSPIKWLALIIGLCLIIVIIIKLPLKQLLNLWTASNNTAH